MKITLCEALGSCFGVEKAVEQALTQEFRNNLTIIGELVHNPQTLDKLKRHGVRQISSINELEGSGHNVMITAHGAPDSLIDALKAQGSTVFDASCPLVKKVHRQVELFINKGFHPVVIGQKNHVEVRGITGDLIEYSVINHKDELHTLEPYDSLGVVSQTTQPLLHVKSLLVEIRKLYPEKKVEFFDTICQPTKLRQKAVLKLAPEVDIMLVIGGMNSSNTRKLKLLCEKLGAVSYHIESTSDIVPEWFSEKSHVGITAGTSTPREVINLVVDYLKSLFSHQMD